MEDSQMATRAVSYVRCSTAKQAETSPDQQRIEIDRWAKANGYEIVREYADIGISGDRTEDRVEFQKMVKDSACGEFKAIVCWDQSRFGRFDLIEAGKWIHPIRQSGVHLATVCGGVTDWNDVVDQLTFMAGQMGKHQFLKDLGANVTRSQRKKAEDGQWAAGKAPFGYCIGDDGKLSVVPHDAEIVVELFNRYASGSSIRDLAGYLEGRCVKSPIGRSRWSTSGLGQLLRNDAYIGHIKHGRKSSSKYQDDCINEQRRKIEQPESAWTVTINAHEPIVDVATFNRVQDALEKRRRHTGPRANGDHVFKGMLVCSHCGSVFHGRTNSGRTKTKKYICSGYKPKGDGCKRYIVDENELLKDVLWEIRHQIHGDEYREKLDAAWEKHFDGIMEWEESLDQDLPEDELAEIIEREESRRWKLYQRDIAGVYPDLLDPPPSLIDEKYKRETRRATDSLKKLEGERDRLHDRLCGVDDDMVPIVQKRIRENDAKIAAAKKASEDLDGNAQFERDRQRWLEVLEFVENLPALTHDPVKLRAAMSEYGVRVTLKMDKGDDGSCQILEGEISMTVEGVSPAFGEMAREIWSSQAATTHANPLSARADRAGFPPMRGKLGPFFRASSGS